MKNPILDREDYTKNTYRCQYLIVGTGAGGSVAGALLAESGRDVIFLEEGGYYPTESCTSDISEMTAQLYRNQGVFPLLGKPSIALAEGCCVGGGTIINGALICPTPPWVLDEWQNDYGLKGYGQKDLEKHFETVNKDLHVIKHEIEEKENLDSLKLLKAAEQLGWKCDMATRAVNNCKNTNLCPTGCTSGAKQSALETYLPRAMKKGARIFTRCRAVKIIHSNRKAKKIIVRVMGDKSRHMEISFDHLVMAGGAVQTPHMLQRSGISRLAGRNLQFHMNLKVVARFKDILNAEQGTMFTVQMQEFDREGLLIMASNIKPHYVAMTLSQYSNDVINSVLENYQNLGIFTAMIRPRSIAHIISRLGDRPLVLYRFNPDDMSMIRTALKRTANLLFHAGAIELYMPVAGIGMVKSLNELDRKLDGLKPENLEIVTVHIMSSCPMGPDSATSVVNPDGKLWNMENILVTDASVLPSNIGKNPQGTIMAFAHEIINRHI
ncbi:MAG TPA: GMC family oxidoreductase [Nitrospirae bacterium]|nr:oxygen-dependent choline dehydrogenase [bacterium BMS3Abin06]HDH11469.1 GMC family oxidoreductase [Nitrospirota bacterium]HDZ01377.1 GMC family oxidoreductase [Nitrospirota bacterium]